MRCTSLLFILAMVVPTMSGCAATEVSDGAAYGQLRPHLLETTLTNGLRIYMVEDHSSPLVSYQSWVHVGSINERQAGPKDDHGLTGLSHFFEHMMFRGTERFPDYFEEIYALGGRLNAFTWHDETVYWENVPSQHLKRVIAMEADRMEHMTVDFLSLEPEREAVKAERLLRTENSSEGKAWEVLQSRVFKEFPYHWGTIGWMKDLNAIEINEAAEYHKLYYVPNNTTIFVVGDHDPVETLGWIKEFYQHLPEKPLPPERYKKEPEQTEERRDVVLKPTNPQFVMWAWPTPSPRDRDFLVLEVLDRILAGGRAARLQKALVYSKPPHLSRLYAYLLPMRYPYMYVWGAVIEPGMSVEYLQEIVDSELSMIVANGVSDKEINRAIATLRSDVVRRNLSNHSKAEAMGFSLRTSDNPLAWVERLEQYETVDSDEIRRVAGALLTPSRRTWVPVVDPGRLPTLASIWSSSPPAMPVRLAAALRSSAEVVINRQALDAQEQALQLEEDAIARLERRADLAMKDAPEARAKAIDTYLSENKRGAVARHKSLESGLEEADAARAALGARIRALRQEWRALQRQDWHEGEKQEHTMLAMHIIEAALDPRNPPPPPAPSLEDWSKDARLGPHVLAHGAMLAWLLDAHGMKRSGQRSREQVLKWSRGQSRNAGSLVAAARALAWDTQVWGLKLKDQPPRRRK